VGKYGSAGEATDDNIIHHMCFTCWITKGTDMLLEYVILTAFPQQPWYANTPQYYVHTYMACIIDIH